jgi:transcription termination factor Rho
MATGQVIKDSAAPILGAERQPPRDAAGSISGRGHPGRTGRIFVTETTESLDTSAADAKVGTADATGSGRGRARRGEGLSSMVLPDLKALAGQLGIRGTSGMRKGDLVAAITARQNGAGASAPKQDTTPRNARGSKPPRSAAANGAAPAEQAAATAGTNGHSGDPQLPLGDLGGAPEHRETAPDNARPDASGGIDTRPDQGQHPGQEQPSDQGERGDQGEQPGDRGQSESGGEPSADSEDGGRNRRNRRGRRDGREFNDNGAAPSSEGNRAPQDAPSRDQSRDNQGRDNQNRNGQSRDGQRDQNRDNQGRDNQGRDNQGRDNQGRDNQNRQGGGRQNTDVRNGPRDDDEDGDGRGRRGRRYRDRNRRTTRDRFAPDGPAEPEVRDDDVLVPVAGILDVLDSYAFIRTSGYLTGPNDVYVSLSQVRKNGLRRGDAVTGAVRAQRDGEAQRQKFNALVRLDSVNGLEPEQARNRPEFTKLTPLYPNDRLRLETEAHLLTTRVIDLVMPVGKGQRALIVSPPKAGKTMVMQAIANAITTNNPECHLMVVLVDERPEEVTDMQRSVKGEVIASTFDRPPSDHTLVAELAIERAKRLVEMGRDVVVLLDSITRLGRAYNLAAPASGRILSGGVDSTALFPPKRFLGAARNIENGGSLTIFASALVETGSAGDTVIFEEFKGTGNAELKLDRRLADKRIFPAIDVDQSSTRKEDLLLSPDELAIVVKLRRVLAALDTQQALELVLDRLRKTRSNVEFLMQVAKNTPGND